MSETPLNLYRPNNYLDNLNSLRTLRIPKGVVLDFLEISEENTQHNTETLGILCGLQKENELHCKGLVLPKQSGDPYSCDCSDEELLLESIESQNWISLGWIHTHPKHSLFLSSVDMHTQYNYQCLLPEALALVYSPICAQKLSAFSLTQKGLSEISKCQNRGFHPHFEGLFQEASHAVYEEHLGYRIFDLRN